MNEKIDLNKVVFVVGALRSGTTLLHLMLRHVSGINHVGEWDFLFEHYPGGDKEAYDVDRYRAWLITNRPFCAMDLVINKTLSHEDLLVDFVRQREKPGQLIVINVHRNFHLIPALFPGAKIIHLLRDPRDVARSCIAMGWAGTPYCGVGFWMKSEESWSVLAKSLHHDQYLRVTFEQLIATTDDVIAKICNYLKLPFDLNYIEYADHSTYSKPDVSLIEQWKRKMSSRDVQLIEYKLGSLLETRGYIRSKYPQLHSVSYFTLLKLALGDWMSQYHFGIRRYGVALFVGEKIARRLLLRSWHVQLVLKKNAIDSKILK